MPAGRPTDYDDQVIPKLLWYLDNHIECDDIVPSAAGFAVYMGVSRATVYNWADKHPEFLDTLGLLNSQQEKACVSNGLTNEWNSTIVKLLLANHGYHDKKDVEATVKDYRVIPADEGAIDDDD